MGCESSGHVPALSADHICMESRATMRTRAVVTIVRAITWVGDPSYKQFNPS
jgi:hypothetical protein